MKNKNDHWAISSFHKDLPPGQWNQIGRLRECKAMENGKENDVRAKRLGILKRVTTGPRLGAALA